MLLVNKERLYFCTYQLSLLLGEEAVASPSIGNTTVRFNNVHASGYNSAGSERIWMKFGALRVQFKVTTSLQHVTNNENC